MSTAHRLALESTSVRADMVESATFPHLSVRYNVSSVPKTVINHKHEVVGAVPMEKLLDVIEKME